MLDMKMIILSSVILYCFHCCHLNWNKFPHDTRSCVVVNVAFLLKVFNRNCYPGVIVIWKNWKIKSKMFKAEGRVKKHITYMNHIKITWCHMIVVSMSKHDMAKAKMCTYPQSDHALTHRKCIFRCCSDYPCGQEYWYMDSQNNTEICISGV